MPRCPCLAHRGLYAERRFHRREVVSGLLHRLRLHRLQGWWDAGTGWWDAGAEAEVSGSQEQGPMSGEKVVCGDGAGPSGQPSYGATSSPVPADPSGSSGVEQ